MTDPNTSLEPKELGTLIVVVGKARNLPNKSRFGKQDPFVTVTINEDKKKTKPIKRGGQHPEWDEEVRFTIIEDLDDVLQRSESQPDGLAASASLPAVPPKEPGAVTAAALAEKSRKGPIRKKGGKHMKVACYADDAKEPELIGECVVGIDDVLKQGEVDEWYTFTHKDKYSGEIYLELTFYSNDAPPVKRNVPRPSVSMPGTWDTSTTASSSLSTLNSRQGGLATSGSVSGMSLYIPPYAQPNRAPSPAPSAAPPSMNGTSGSFANLGLPAGHTHVRHHSLTPTLPAQPSYPPGNTLSPVDSLSQQASMLSLNSAYAADHQPAAFVGQAQSLGHHYGGHRHSVGSTSQAPWGGLMPQSQPAPLPPPTSRPQSTSAVPPSHAPWQQDPSQVAEQDRRRLSATPVPRPLSVASSTYQTPPPHHLSSSQSAPFRAPSPSPVPDSLRPALPTAGHANSFSGPGYSSTPVPTPPHASSAPPGGHYQQIPTSSYAGQPPGRAPSPMPVTGYMSPTTPTPAPYQAMPSSSFPTQQSYDALGRSNSYSSQHQTYPAQHDSPYGPSQTTHQTSYPVHSPPPVQTQTTAGGSSYVPWYQQTQPVASPPHPTPAPQQPAYDPYAPPDQRYAHTPAPPPPVPARRPMPQPPQAQPTPPKVGYYPSDELYAIQRDDSSTPVPGGSHWQGGQPSYPTANGYGGPSHTQQQPGQYGSAYPPSTAPYVPEPNPVQLPHQQYPPQQNGWQPSTAPQAPYRATSPMPVNVPPQTYDSPSPYPHRQPSPAPFARQPSPSPQPVSQYGQYPQAHDPYPARSPSPLPPSQPLPSTNQGWRSYMQSLGTGSGPQQTPPRAPSPQPPPKDDGQVGQQQWYTPPPSLPSSIKPPDGWRSSLPAASETAGHQWGR